MTLHGTTVLFFAGPLYEDLELWYPKIRLEEEGARTVVAGTGERTYQGKRGYPLTVDATRAMKVAATLTSTGTPAIFLHPIDALHGDLARDLQAGEAGAQTARQREPHPLLPLHVTTANHPFFHSLSLPVTPLHIGEGPGVRFQQPNKENSHVNPHP